MKKIDLFELNKTLNIAKLRINNHSIIFGSLYCSTVLDPAINFTNNLIHSDNVRFRYLDINKLELAKLKNFKEKTFFSYERSAIEEVLYLYSINKSLGSISKYWMVRNDNSNLQIATGRR